MVYINLLYDNTTDEDKVFFFNRGLSEATIKKHKLCIGALHTDRQGGPRAIFPTWKDDQVVTYSGRSLTPEQKLKYKNVTGGKFLFNSNTLKGLEAGSKVIITESQLETLLLEQLGFKSVSISSCHDTSLLTESLKFVDGVQDLNYYTMFDNDKGGDGAREKMNQYKHLKVPLKYNDIGDWYLEEKDQIKENIEKQMSKLKRPDSVLNYINDKLKSDIDSHKQFKDRKTGFDNLDDITSLYPGLYVIGGLSTLGKTTFTHQLADQMAEKGEHVLFFSLEMATLELVTKSIARLTAKDGLEHGISSLKIRMGKQNKAIDKAIEEYKPISNRFNIIEGNSDTTTSEIRRYVKDYIDDNKVKPVVVIDYLQIIPCDKNSWNKRDDIDMTVTGLKQLSRDYNITVIVVSSLNRSNYLTPIDFESFKESGGIEYTADVVWGLQLQAVKEELFNHSQKIKEKRERINEAKKADPRKIELVCLKNRNGISNYSCNFDYYPKYDLFKSMKEERRR